MSEVTRLLDAARAGDAAASAELLPLVYGELRRLARRRMAREAAGHTLQPTGLVHEAYLRLVRSPDTAPGRDEPGWDSRGHFFAAAAEAMRRILIESARRKARLKHGGGRRRVGLEESEPAAPAPGFADDGGLDELLALDAALERFEVERPRAAAVVKLRYFAGLSFEETAAALHVSRATAVRDWTLGRAWLFREMGGRKSGGG